MTDTVIIGTTPTCKKAYSVRITERKVNERGKTTGESVTSTTFQIKDIAGNSNVKKIKEKLMEALR
jgi:hypothetical protein